MTAPVEFKVYPGARSEPWLVAYRNRAMKVLKKLGGRTSLEMWITDDSFEDVGGFYRTLAPEHQSFAESVARNLSVKTGRDVRASYFMLDRAAGPLSSTCYVAIQHPVVIQFEPLEIQEVTSIALYRKAS